MRHRLRVNLWTGNTSLIGPPSLNGVDGLTGQTCRRPKDSNFHRVDSLSQVQNELWCRPLLIIIHEEVHGNIRILLRSLLFLLLVIYCFHMVLNVWRFCLFLSHEAVCVLSKLFKGFYFALTGLYWMAMPPSNGVNSPCWTDQSEWGEDGDDHWWLGEVLQAKFLSLNMLHMCIFCMSVDEFLVGT